MTTVTQPTIRWISLPAIIMIVLAVMAPCETLARALPKGFVYLRDVDASILQDMRYATRHNFTGARVPGYQSNECVLAKPAAQALARVQRDLLRRSLSLKVYDCYRPDRAVKAFLRWARSKRNTAATRAYHPGLTKPQVVAQGYVSPRSTHSTGRAIDLTIVKLPIPEAPPPGRDPEKSCIASRKDRRPDSSVDMGTGYDCFHRRSHTWNRSVGAVALRWRRVLVEAMRAHGFRNYRKEWWHFNYPTSGFQRRLDFVVPNRTGTGSADRRKSSVAIPRPDEIVIRLSPHDVNKTTDQLVRVSKAQGLRVVARKRQKIGASVSGGDPQDGEIVMISTPAIEAQLKRLNAKIGREFPLKIYVWARQEGGSFIAYDRPSALQTRYEIAGHDTLFEQLATLVGDLVADSIF